MTTTNRYVKDKSIRRLAEASLPTIWTDIADRPHSQRENRAWALYEATSALLSGWTMQEVEEAAWLFAIDGWQRPPPLVEDYDEAFHSYYLPLLFEFRHSANSEGFAGLSVVFEELRNRVQFIQARGADIRLSGQLDRLVPSAIERLEPSLRRLEQRIAATHGPDEAKAELERFVDEGRADLLLATARAIGKKSPELAAGVAATSQDLARVVALAGEILRALPVEVGSNIIVAALGKLCEIGTQ